MAGDAYEEGGGGVCDGGIEVWVWEPDVECSKWSAIGDLRKVWFPCKRSVFDTSTPERWTCVNIVVRRKKTIYNCTIAQSDFSSNSLSHVRNHARSRTQHLQPLLCDSNIVPAKQRAPHRKRRRLQSSPYRDLAQQSFLVTLLLTDVSLSRHNGLRNPDRRPTY